ncbi:MAG: enoyl-CoA hydratase/isomerase family protein [Thermodesulfobacteriota bacterium]
MNFINVSINEEIAEIVIDRPKVNALNEIVVEELNQTFRTLSKDSDTRAIILSGNGSFFSFGFDVPELYSYPKEAFLKFVFKFSDLLKNIFLFPKPVIAALNGHTIAGGACVALACDYRLMVQENAKISFNEITFGSTLFSTVVDILKFLVGAKNSSTIIYSGMMYTAEEAIKLGLIEQVVSKVALKDKATNVALDLTKKDYEAFKSIKYLLRENIATQIENKESDSISEFVDLWYSKSTRNNLQKIKIYD